MSKPTQIAQFMVCPSCLIDAKDAGYLVDDPNRDATSYEVIESPDAYVVQIFTVVEDDKCEYVEDHAYFAQEAKDAQELKQ